MEINLAANNLTGTFPREVILLNETLTVFDIGSNNIFNKGDGMVFLRQLTNLGKSSWDVTACVGYLCVHALCVGSRKRCFLTYATRLSNCSSFGHW